MLVRLVDEAVLVLQCRKLGAPNEVKAEYGGRRRGAVSIKAKAMWIGPCSPSICSDEFVQETNGHGNLRILVTAGDLIRLVHDLTANRLAIHTRHLETFTHT